MMLLLVMVFPMTVLLMAIDHLIHAADAMEGELIAMSLIDLHVYC